MTNSNKDPNQSNSDTNFIDSFNDLVDSKPISDMRPITEGFALDISVTEKPSNPNNK